MFLFAIRIYKMLMKQNIFNMAATFLKYLRKLLFANSTFSLLFFVQKVVVVGRSFMKKLCQVCTTISPVPGEHSGTRALELTH